MTQAVDQTRASTSRAGAQVQAGHAQVSGASFGSLLSLLDHPAAGIGPRPEGIGGAVRAESKDPGRVDLDDIAAEEMRTASDEPKTSRARSVDRGRYQAETGATPAPQPRSAPQAPNSDAASSAQAPAGPRAGTPSSPEDPPKQNDRAPARSERSGRGATKLVPAAAVAPAAKPVAASTGAAPAASGVRSVGAVGGAQPGGRDLLAKLTTRQNPPILRASKDELPAQVSRAMARIVSEGGGRITLRLNPQALGEVRVDVDMHRGVARATLNAQTEAARELLHSELDALRAALERRGVSVERLEVAGPSADGAGANQHGGVRDDGDNPAAPDRSNSHGRSAGHHRGSAEPDPSADLHAEHGADAIARTPVRTDADGVVRVDAIA